MLLQVSIIYLDYFFQWILPEMVAHGVITILLLAHFQWIFFMLNTPLLGWLVYRWVYYIFIYHYFEHVGLPVGKGTKVDVTENTLETFLVCSLVAGSVTS